MTDDRMIAGLRQGDSAPSSLIAHDAWCRLLLTAGKDDGGYTTTLVCSRNPKWDEPVGARPIQCQIVNSANGSTGKTNAYVSDGVRESTTDMDINYGTCAASNIANSSSSADCCIDPIVCETGLGGFECIATGDANTVRHRGEPGLVR